MSPSKILIGQFLIVLTTIVATMPHKLHAELERRTAMPGVTKAKVVEDALSRYVDPEANLVLEARLRRCCAGSCAARWPGAACPPISGSSVRSSGGGSTSPGPRGRGAA